MNTSANPLLHIGHPIPFGAIRPEHALPAVERLIQDARATLDGVASVSVPRTFDNTMRPLDTVTEALRKTMTIVTELTALLSTTEWKTARDAVEPLASEFHSSIPMHEGVWRALREYAKTPEATALTGARRRFFENTLDDFRRNGAELAPADKETLSALDIELAQETTKFAQHVLDATDAFELVLTDAAILRGLPENAIEAARESAQKMGIDGWRFTLQAPSYAAVLTYLDDRETRKRLYVAYNVERATREPYDNRVLLQRILELRAQKARLLGFANFADLVLADRMAKTGDAALAFVEDLREKTEEAFRREFERLSAFRRELEGPDAPALESWDIAYYAEKQRKAHFDFNEEDLRPYFVFDDVLQGAFGLAERLYGIRIAETSGAETWHDHVKYFEVHDEAGALLGAFYADWFPRDGKRDGAWMDEFILGDPKAGGTEPHVGLICGNVTPPVGAKPALLTHREVETIFHEFGHLLHHLLAEPELYSQGGTRVAWDFVELPSQIMENWCWEKPMLDVFARHYETRQAMPEDLFRKLERSRTFLKAGGQMRQLSFGTLDLMLHTAYNPDTDGDALAYVRNIQQDFSPVPLLADYAMVAAFTHLFGDPVGYAGAYYSYKWAEILDADAFTRFKKEGILNPETGSAFRTRILSRGDSEDPNRLFRDFMGRDPDASALLRRLGLLK